MNSYASTLRRRQRRAGPPVRAEAFYPPEFERLEDRCLLAADFTQVKAKLDSLLSTLQTVVNTEALGKSLPLIGSQLGSATASQIEFLQAIQSDIDGALSGAEASAAAVQSALNSALSSILSGTISVDTSNPDDVKFQVHLHQNLANVSTGSFNFDIGLPGLGLKASSGPNNSVTAQVGFDVYLDFEVTPTDVMLDPPPSPNHEIDVSLNLQLPSTFDATGSLAFLQLDLKGSDNQGHALTNVFSGDVTFDLNSPVDIAQIGSYDFVNNATIGVDAQADANLNAVVSFSGSAVFPSLSSVLHLGWGFGSEVDQAHPETPDVAFQNVQLNLGTFFSNFVSPILSEINTVLKPVKPILDILQTPVPVISDLLGHSESFLDLATTLGFVSPSTAQLLTAVTTLVDLAASVPNDPSDGQIAIDIGTFDLSSVPGVPDLTKSEDLSNLDLSSLPQVNDVAQQLGAVGGALQSAAQSASSFIAQTEGAAAGGLTFPILDNPSSVFGLFIGKPVDLFDYKMPELNVGFNMDEFFPILGPLGVELKGNASAKIDAEFGYDTYGLTTGDPFQGFFLKDDATSVTLNAGISAYAALNVVVASAGVGGGVNANIVFTPDDPDNDGKVRPADIATDLQNGLFCLFDPTGSVTAGLDAYVKVGFDTPFGFVGWSDDYTIAQATLIDFSNGCGSPSNTPPQPDLGDVNANGVLTLNMGPYAANRGVGDTTDDSEDFTVTHISGDPSSPQGETVEISAFGATTVRSGVKSIYAEGGLGSNTIKIAPGVLAPATIYGAFNPALHPGQNEDTGQNLIQAGDGNSTLYAGDGGDHLIAGKGNDDLYGGAGDDVLTGGPGNDYLNGGGGNNRLFGGTGTSILVGGTSGDPNGVGDLIQAGTGDDTIFGGPYANTYLITNPANTLLASHGSGITIFGSGASYDNQLVMTGGGGPGFNETYELGSNSGSGVVTTTDGSVSQTITFSGFGNTQPLFDTVTVNQLTVDGHGQSTTLKIGDSPLSFDVSGSNGSPTTTINGSEVGEVSASQFPPIIFGNKTNVVVNDIGPGSTVYLQATQQPEGLATLTVTLGAGANTVFVYSTPAGVTTTINGSAGTNVFNVGEAFSIFFPFQVVDHVQGSLVLIGGGADTLNVDDNGSLIDKSGALAGTLTSTMITGLGMGAGITYSGMTTVDVSLGFGHNQFNIQSTDAAAVTTISGLFGVDTFYVGSLADNLPQNGSTLGGIAGALVLNGAGGDAAYIDDTGSTGGLTGLLTATAVTGLGMGASVTYAGLATLNVSLGGTGNTFNVRSTAAPTTTTVDPTGSNTYNVGSTAGASPPSPGILDLIQGPLVIEGGSLSTLNIDDSGSTGPKSGTLTGTSLTGFAMGPGGITYSGISTLNMTLGSGGNALAIQVDAVHDLPALTTIDGGASNHDSLTATFAQDFNGTLDLTRFELATFSVGRNVNGTLNDSNPGAIQSFTVGGSITPTGLIQAGSLNVLTIGPNQLSPGHDMAGRLVIAGTLGQMTVAGGTPGTIQAGRVGTIGVYGGYGPLVLQVLEAGIQRRVEAAASAGNPYPTPAPPPAPTPVVSPAGVLFQFFYEGLASPLNLANPQLTARITNSAPATDQYDLSLVVWNDVAKFNLARLDATGASGLRNLAIEGDLLSSVSAAAAGFLGASSLAPGVQLPLDNVAGVAVRDFAPNGEIRARSIQAVAFGSHLEENGCIETGAQADAWDAAALLAWGTAIVQAGSTNGTLHETFRVPFADLPTQQVGFFLATEEYGGQFDARNIALTVEGVSNGVTTQPSNVARGAVTALIGVTMPLDARGNPEDMVVNSVDFRGDGASIKTAQWISDRITSTGPLGDVEIDNGAGITNITAPSIFGNIITNGPITGTIQTTGLRTDPITSAVTMVSADLGRSFVVMGGHGEPPCVVATVIHAAGGGLFGQIISRGALISQVIADGGISGLIAAQGDIGQRASITLPSGQTVTGRVGGILSNGATTGQVVTLGNILGDLTFHGGLKTPANATTGAHVAAQGSILGNTTIDGAIDPGSALVAGGQIGDPSNGTVLSAPANHGIIAANGAITFDKHVPNGGYLFSNLPAGSPSALAIDAVFADGLGNPLTSFDSNAGEDLANLFGRLLPDLARLRVVKTGTGQVVLSDS